MLPLSKVSAGYNVNRYTFPALYLNFAAQFSITLRPRHGIKTVRSFSPQNHLAHLPHLFIARVSAYPRRPLFKRWFISEKYSLLFSITEFFHRHTRTKCLPIRHNEISAPFIAGGNDYIFVQKRDLSWRWAKHLIAPQDIQAIRIFRGNQSLPNGVTRC